MTVKIDTAGMAMRDIADLETRLLSELQLWFSKQVRDEFSDFYLYYLPTTNEHCGGIVICKEQPPNAEYKLAMPERIRKHCTIEQNFNWIRLTVLRSLPVLSIS